MQVVEAHGFRIAHVRTGEGHPLVLVHGAGEDSRTWQSQLAGLADEFTVVAWDEPGAGRSCDLPEGMTLEGFADALAVLIDSLRLGPAHVAGFSWGGTVVLELYRRHPALVATLIMIDTYAGWKGSLPANEVRARAAGSRRAPRRFRPHRARTLRRRPARGVRAVARRRRRCRPPRNPGAGAGHHGGRRPERPAPWNRRSHPAHWGDSDVRSPLSVALDFQRKIPDTHLVVIEGAGHMSHLERPEYVNDALRRFCRAHTPQVT